MDCLFCKIIAGEVPSTKVYEDEYVYAFLDISPQAPEHVVIVPKEHITSANEINAENSALVAKIFEAVPKIAKERGIAEDGYRVVNNCGVMGGQTVGHLHFHLLGGRNLGWPPG
ncbi:MAG TPA: histidine triad nucleotide-binding protein [Firmicutes bacterium]|nr:histidine triad nucleotide-binding protein [Bacillota bacterium]